MLLKDRRTATDISKDGIEPNFSPATVVKRAPVEFTSTSNKEKQAKDVCSLHMRYSQTTAGYQTVCQDIPVPTVGGFSRPVVHAARQCYPHVSAVERNPFQGGAISPLFPTPAIRAVSATVTKKRRQKRRVSVKRRKNERIARRQEYLVAPAPHYFFTTRRNGAAITMNV